MSDNASSAQLREKTIVRTGIIGIAANVLLAAFKAFVGITASSVAVISDAVNNLSDALSSLVTIIGTKLAAKPPDKKHPLGYGRLEYMSALIVSGIVLYAGITAFTDSVGKMISPEAPEYSVLSLIILGVAVGVKIVLGLYTKAKGKSVHSGSLTASGEDALNDAILSSSVIAAAVVYMVFGVSLEAWVGAGIAVFIIKAGIELISEAVNEMLGARADAALIKDIKTAALGVPGVLGVYDVIVNNYGPDRDITSLHAEVGDTLTAREIDSLSREIQKRVFGETGVIVAAVGIYSFNTSDDEETVLREKARRIAMAHEGVLQFHGFYADIEAKTMVFDIILDYAAKDREKLFAQIKSEEAAAFPDYSLHITLDIDAGEF